MTEVREVTLSSGTFVSWVIRSSCRPSAKARLSSVPARSANGRTATAWRDIGAEATAPGPPAAATDVSVAAPATEASAAGAAPPSGPAPPVDRSPIQTAPTNRPVAASAASPAGQRRLAGCATIAVSSPASADSVRRIPSGVDSNAQASTTATGKPTSSRTATRR
jgi:hypothetical protein